MALVREIAAKMLVLFAIAAIAVALGTWWASLLVIKSAGTLSSYVEKNATHEIAAQLDRLKPGTAALPDVQSAIKQALRNPIVTQALADSSPKGSSTLTKNLKNHDPTLAALLGGSPLSLNVGQHALAKLASRLRGLARAALIAAGAFAGAAFVLSPLRHLVLRHLALGIGFIGGVTLLGSWASPALVRRFTHGGIHSAANTILVNADPVRTTVLLGLLGGAVVFLATHVFELVGGRRLPSDIGDHPLPTGSVV